MVKAEKTKAKTAAPKPRTARKPKPATLPANHNHNTRSRDSSPVKKAETPPPSLAENASDTDDVQTAPNLSSIPKPVTVNVMKPDEEQTTGQDDTKVENLPTNPTIVSTPSLDLFRLLMRIGYLFRNTMRIWSNTSLCLLSSRYFGFLDLF
jgi:hypothetical protein